MASNGEENVYTRLGARPVINAGGNTTVWGGSTPSPAVMKAMEEAGKSFVEMEELLEASGARIADLLGAEAAYAAAGCYAALVLSTAACITGNDPDKAAQLPDMAGLKSEVVLQQRQRYSYDRAYTVPGSKLVLAGDGDGTTAEQLESAIGPDTAAVAFLVRAEPDDAVVGLEETVDIAHARGVPVIADAAAQIYPIDFFRRNAQSADLVCFGGKYMGAPHSIGFVCGKKDMIEAVTAHGFIGPRPFGRGMKADRQEIIGLVTAIDIWFDTDHEKRSRMQDARYAAIAQGLEGIGSVSTKVAYNERSHTLSSLHVSFQPETVGKDARQVASELDAFTPCIRVNAQGDNTIAINAYTLNEGEEYILANALRSVLTG